MPASVVVAALIGVSLQRASFGFSSAFRLAIEARNTYSLRIQMIMIMLASVFFLPLLSAGEIFGLPLSGFGAGIGVAFAIGALMFGIGMQLSGGCASGTLFALGGGNGKPLATVLGFVIGSTLGVAHIGFWNALPTLPVIFLQNQFGLWPALVLQIGGLSLVYCLAAPYSTRPFLDRDEKSNFGRHLLVGRWPLLWGGVALALLNVLTLVVTGQPWGETSAFALWGSKALELAGVDSVRGWAYWQGNTQALDSSIFEDTATVMDFGIVIGAMFAASISGAFSMRWGGSARIWIAALVGGLLMGYGARLSGGCNIGAYFSAGASGSISAWAWMALALAGSSAGLFIRRFVDAPSPAIPIPVPGC